MTSPVRLLSTASVFKEFKLMEGMFAHPVLIPNHLNLLFLTKIAARFLNSQLVHEVPDDV